MSGDFTTREEILDIYQRRAGIYELAVYGCYLLGFPISRYRQLAVRALAPQPSDTISRSHVLLHSGVSAYCQFLSHYRSCMIRFLFNRRDGSFAAP